MSDMFYICDSEFNVQETGHNIVFHEFEVSSYQEAIDHSRVIVERMNTKDEK